MALVVAAAVFLQACRKLFQEILPGSVPPSATLTSTKYDATSPKDVS